MSRFIGMANDERFISVSEADRSSVIDMLAEDRTGDAVRFLQQQYWFPQEHAIAAVDAIRESERPTVERPTMRCGAD